MFYYKYIENVSKQLFTPTYDLFIRYYYLVFRITKLPKQVFTADLYGWIKLLYRH